MIFKERDPLTGTHRDALFMAFEDATALGVSEGDPLVVRSPAGEVRASAHIARIRPGNVQMFFPECNPLLRAGVRDPESGVPNCNALVEIVPA